MSEQYFEENALSQRVLYNAYIGLEDFFKGFKKQTRKYQHPIITASFTTWEIAVHRMTDTRPHQTALQGLRRALHIPHRAYDKGFTAAYKMGQSDIHVVNLLERPDGSLRAFTTPAGFAPTLLDTPPPSTEDDLKFLALLSRHWSNARVGVKERNNYEAYLHLAALQSDIHGAETTSLVGADETIFVPEGHFPTSPLHSHMTAEKREAYEDLDRVFPDYPGYQGP